MKENSYKSFHLINLSKFSLLELYYQMITTEENIKPSNCSWCQLKFPADDNVRWSLHNINKHISACEKKFMDNEKFHKTQKSINTFFSNQDFYCLSYDNNIDKNSFYFLRASRITIIVREYYAVFLVVFNSISSPK
jgi:hypothetical protein